MRITELVPGEKVAWLVIDNNFNFIVDKTEWKGTKINFEIARNGNKTEVNFTHVGLVPEYECYGVCSNAWGFLYQREPEEADYDRQRQPEPKENQK